MSAFLMASADLSALANAPHQFGLVNIPGRVDLAALYDTLLDENLKSIGARYPDAARISDWCEGGEAVYIYDASAQFKSAEQALSEAQSYAYQSCEHDGWEVSFARAYIEALRASLEPLVKAEAIQTAKDRQTAREALRARLKPVDIGAKETAAIVRKVLKGAFPACKFSVVTERGSMVSSIRIGWTDGPSSKAVDALVQQFKAGDFDGMTDSYNYDRDRYVQFDGVWYDPGCRYVFTNRELSPEFANRCIAQVATYYGGVELVPVAVAGYFGHTLTPEGIGHKPIRPDFDSYRHDWHSCIRRAAEDATEFAREALAQRVTL